MTTDPIALRHQLLETGFGPLTVHGKQVFQENCTERSHLSLAVYHPKAINSELLIRRCEWVLWHGTCELRDQGEHIWASN